MPGEERCDHRVGEVEPSPFTLCRKMHGADIVAWKQAARAELAAASSLRIGYGQALLDIVESFDRIPHWLMVHEAIALGYPL